MYIVTGIPITSIPRPKDQVFSYFYDQPLERGSIAQAPLGKRQTPVLVLSSEELTGKKQAIRKASYKLKSIKRIISERPVFSDEEIKFILWAAEYFFSPLGLMFKIFTPAYLLSKSRIEVKSVFPAAGGKFSFSYEAGNSRFKAYRDAVKKNQKHNHQTLVLFPELEPARAFFDSLGSQAKKKALLWGLDRTPKQGFEVRQGLIDGQFATVVGTRSAITLYLPRLKTVIIEDDSNKAHKSWDQRPYYDIRPMSLELARRHKLDLMWGGIVPSVRASKLGANVSKVKSRESEVKVVDMREELKKGNTTTISGALGDELAGLKKNEQALVLVNRLGEYTVILCRDCGFVLRCSSCDAPLITLRAEQQTLDLFCRYCLTHHKGPDRCPECKGHRFKIFGAGTERVQKELETLFPKHRIARLDSLVLKTRKSYERIVEEFRSGEIDILVGTQMIARPSLLPQVKLCAIVSLETAFLLPEYDGEEEVFHLATKYRELAKDKMIWQTYQPDNRVVQSIARADYKGFLKKEYSLRKKFKWPPFSTLVKLTLNDRDKDRGEVEARGVADRLTKASKKRVEVYGPLQSRVFKIKGRYSWVIIVKVPRSMDLKERNEILSYVPSNWAVDVEPISTL